MSEESIEVRQIDYSETAPFRSLSAKAGAPLTQVKDCLWFGVFVDGVLAGVTCAAWIGNKESRHGRPRATYVDEKYRMRGLYRKLLDFSLTYYNMNGVKVVSAYIEPVLWRYWLRRGFKRLKTIANGALHIQKVYHG